MTKKFTDLVSSSVRSYLEENTKREDANSNIKEGRGENESASLDQAGPPRRQEEGLTTTYCRRSAEHELR